MSFGTTVTPHNFPDQAKQNDVKKEKTPKFSEEKIKNAIKNYKKLKNNPVAAKTHKYILEEFIKNFSDSDECKEWVEKAKEVLK